MTDEVSTTVAALSTILAAIIGAIAILITTFVANRNQRKRERRRTAQDLLRSHLIQLDDSLESLVRRLRNVTAQGGRDVIESSEGGDEYYTTTMLYALGSLLACSRLLLLGGQYAVLDDLCPGKGYGTKLYDQFGKLDRHLSSEAKGREFFRYHRLALAESMMWWDSGSVRIRSSLEFRRAYDSKDDPFFRRALEPAMRFLVNSPDNKLKKLISQLDEIKLNVTNIRRCVEPQTAGFHPSTEGPI